jgi:hypothetical protein
MSGTYERPELAVLAEVESLARHLGEELATWRRRCLRAEAEVQDHRGKGGTSTGPGLAQSRARVAELEQENLELRRRVDSARERLQALTARLAFLERGLSERV